MNEKCGTCRFWHDRPELGMRLCVDLAEVSMHGECDRGVGTMVFGLQCGTRPRGIRACDLYERGEGHK